jgi:hypothetical protein
MAMKTFEAPATGIKDMPIVERIALLAITG